MKLRVIEIEFFRIDMHTRFPFQYGIASMTEVPHLFVRVIVDLNGRASQGISADGLPPKWFTKNPATTFEMDDLPNMLRVIRHAAELAIQLDTQPNFFAWWWQLYTAQQAWARQTDTPPLLAGLGTSLIERAVLDALCRSAATTLFSAVRESVLGIELGVAKPELGALRPRDILPESPRNEVYLRHTVGLGDPLEDHDVATHEELDDGLPHSLRANIRCYGLRYFKIKLSGQRARDDRRLARLATIIAEDVGPDARFTLDGNEQYEDILAFREDWELHRKSPQIQAFIDRCLLFVEQPVHRSKALDESVSDQLHAWENAPAIIIDESDADLDSLSTALRLGYAGTSHKNCKGIMKSLIIAATIANCRAAGRQAILSAEDLGNVGPVALLQDLAVVAALGIGHVERNGHHYFAGLGMFPAAEQDRMLKNHADLYERHDRGFAAIAVNEGKLQLRSVNAAPFGIAYLPDMSQFEHWEF